MAKETKTVDVNEEVASTQQSNGELTYEQIIKKCIASGWVRKNNLKVKNVNITEKDEYSMVSFTVIPPVRGYVVDEETGEYKEGLVNTIYSSSFAIAGCMKENEDLAWLANTIVEKPKSANAFFNGGTIDIMQLDVPAGTEFVNPFASNAEPTTFDHDTIISIIVNVKLGKNGDKLVDAMRAQLAASLM